MTPLYQIFAAMKAQVSQYKIEKMCNIVRKMRLFTK